MLDGDVVVADAQHDEAVLGLFARLLPLGRVGHYQVIGAANVVLRNQLVLNQNQRLHRVLQRQLVLAHLRQDRANVQVDVAGV